MIVTQHEINYQRIEQAILFLEKNFKRQPELTEIAEEAHVSPFHFQRMFTEWAGISPKRFLQFLTVEFLKDRLAKSKNLQQIAEEAGLSSQSRVYDLFTTLESVTPLEYKQKGHGLTIEYGLHETPFGLALIGITTRGVCWLSFITTDEDPQIELEKMKTHWHNSVFHQNENLTLSFLHKIFPSPRPSDTPLPKERGRGEGRIHLLVKGTNFQVKVWDALLKLPMGSVTTYQNIATDIHNPKALQAVGSAVGANHIAYLIPCHRVIRKDGILGEYRWSSVRKKGMIGWEMAAADNQKE
ncbi:MAG: methylated-DNA--[protein]-cysteine S-methyltransferase [Cyclobacteriaceae bacterium]|jgi:AraC family transcriptional regulator, regulatory protein of adaptative response / methylated-DNA-[protein]-cysteine methyltransferase|nr:methylated-DNA--[protein]-cysteine S-methyltransferase [Cyclobacteriaceae bacterium]